MRIRQKGSLLSSLFKRGAAIKGDVGMAVIGYVRVSDDEQNENLQVDALRAEGCDVLYGDHGVSGAVVKRKGLDKVLATLKKGDTFVVWKLDRLGRSAIHLILLLDDLRQRGINFISTTQAVNTTTVEGRLFYGQLALFAEYEREVIRQRTKAGMAAARKRGVHVGRPRKLSDETLALILQQRTSNPPATYRQLALRFGVSIRTLSRELNVRERRLSDDIQTEKTILPKIFENVRRDDDGHVDIRAVH